MISGKKTICTIFLLLFFCFLILFVPWVPKLKWGSIDLTRWETHGKTSIKLSPKHKNWYPLSQVSQHTINAIIVAEDANFMKHIGIDVTAIFESFKDNWKAGRIIRGGSTISQQLIRITLLNSEKSYIRKSREIIGALIAELLLSKEEILEWYLNTVYFGEGIYGIKQAAKIYFKTSPELLSLNQSIQLAIVLPAPNVFSNFITNKKLTTYGHKRFNFILNQLLNQKYISTAQYETAYASGDFGNAILK